jgi:hypothetical protein
MRSTRKVHPNNDNSALSYKYRHTSLYCASHILRFFFLQVDGLLQPCVEKVCRRYNSICSLRVSHFGNSRNISNFSIIIIISVMVITDLTIAIDLGRTNRAHIRRPT